MSSDLDKISAIRAAMPAEGLFAGKEWLVAPEPFAIDEKLHDELQKLGHRLNLFNLACNLLYRMSVEGKQPRWVADYLDRGKPTELVEYARQKKFRDDISHVIRPDVILTETGPDNRVAFTIAELDTVPGGIGLTAWLNQTYASFGTFDILGGADGMIEGFRSLLPDGGDIIISEESATYRPEMQWLARQLRERGVQIEVRDAANFSLNPETGTLKSIYRFFELFDLPNIPCAPALMQAALDGNLRITPPSNPSSKKKCGLHYSGCDHCANSGGASSARNISCACRTSSPTPG